MILFVFFLSKIFFCFPRKFNLINLLENYLNNIIIIYNTHKDLKWIELHLWLVQYNGHSVVPFHVLLTWLTAKFSKLLLLLLSFWVAVAIKWFAWWLNNANCLIKSVDDDWCCCVDDSDVVNEFNILVWAKLAIFGIIDGCIPRWLTDDDKCNNEREFNRNFSISASFSRFSLALRFYRLFFKIIIVKFWIAKKKFSFTWNQIFTCVSVKFNELQTMTTKIFDYQRYHVCVCACLSLYSHYLENSARSAMDRYCLWWNFFSNANNCCVVNGVRGLRFDLWRLSWHLTGPVYN